jgi:hypothetical protein
MQEEKPSFWSVRGSFKKPTPEYVAGIFAGFGMGVIVFAGHLFWPMVPGFWLIAIGHAISSHYQRKERAAVANSSI